VEAIRVMPPREHDADRAPPQAGPRADVAPPPDLNAPPAPPAPPEALPPTAVAAPSPSIAFAVPVEGPTRIVDAKLAVPVAARPPLPVAPPVRHLTFGVGEGRQPDPEYPHDAVLAHEEGTVVVRFKVGQDGRVLSAVVTQPSRWPLLNQAALRAVRDEWRLSPGKAGTYDIPIQFVLTRN
jgi:protein TonB